MMKPTPSDLKKHLGFWMRLVSNNVSQAFARKLEDSGVTVAEWVILREMYSLDGIMAPSRVSETTGLTRGAVSKLIERLLAKSLVTRKESKEDRRYQEIQLTKNGRDLVPHLALLADQNDEEFFSGLNKEERKTLLNLLMKTAELNELSQMPTE